MSELKGLGDFTDVVLCMPASRVTEEGGTSAGGQALALDRGQKVGSPNRDVLFPGSIAAVLKM